VCRLMPPSAWVGGGAPLPDVLAGISLTGRVRAWGRVRPQPAVAEAGEHARGRPSTESECQRPELQKRSACEFRDAPWADSGTMGPVVLGRDTG
jgi:hypothetical protein